MSAVSRRELVQLLAAVPALAQSGAGYVPRFFTKDEYAWLDQMTEALLPGEPDSPGARESNVCYFIDTVLHWGDATLKQQWRAGAAAMQALGIPPTDAVAKLPSTEPSPSTDAEKFFVAFKRMTIDAYCQSEVAQKKVFGYKGSHAVRDFPGCS